MSSPATPTQQTTAASGPVVAADRVTSLDAIRGVATLGILPMNALSFGLIAAAYSNVSADGIQQPFDWVVGILTMVLIDQKMMGLFSLLFGVGVVVFADRAKARGRRFVWLSLWRFLLLFVIGIAHSILWVGDVLILYAICAPVVLLLHRAPVLWLLVLGAALAVTGSLTAPMVQSAVGADYSQLRGFWYADASADEMIGLVFSWFFFDACGRALGFMFIGVALFKSGILQGQRDDQYYWRMSLWGLGAGTAITAAGLVFRMASDWSPDYAITGHMPTGLGTIPMALGYMALIIMWNRRGGKYVGRVRNVGAMALTNYLTQTIIGVFMLTWWFDNIDLSRTMIFVWILGIWVLQLWWSTWWLTRFRYGPAEWIWRCATYAAWQPLRHQKN